jgi:hypothetical protein
MWGIVDSGNGESDWSDSDEATYGAGGKVRG